MDDSTIMFTMLIILNIVGAYINWWLKDKWLMWLNIILIIIPIYFILK
jgi:hypothetical protein